MKLNELGKEQAANLGKVNSNIVFDVIFTSDLVRVIDSANIAFPNVKKFNEYVKLISQKFEEEG